MIKIQIPIKQSLKASLLLISAILLASCNSSGTSKVEDTLDINSQQQLSGVPQADQVQDPRAYCPKTVLRAGTETLNIYPEKVKAEDEDAASKLRWRATITEIARECNSAGAYLNMRVGVRGRFISGPKGESGAFTMPVRIAVTQGENTLYSQLHQLPGEIQPGQRNGSFSYVDSNISILKPDSKNILVYVGFDEGPYDTP